MVRHARASAYTALVSADRVSTLVQTANRPHTGSEPFAWDLRGTCVERLALRGKLAVVAPVDLGELSRVGWAGRGKRGTDLFHEAQRTCWCPDTEDVHRVIGRVSESVSDAARRQDQAPGRGQLGLGAASGHGQGTVEYVDRFVEVVVDVRWWSGEAWWHGQFAECETGALSEDADDISGVRDDTGGIGARLHAYEGGALIERRQGCRTRYVYRAAWKSSRMHGSGFTVSCNLASDVRRCCRRPSASVMRP